MPLLNGHCSPEEVLANAECLLGIVAEVQGVLRRKGFTGHAIEQAVTALYRAAMPYIKGTKPCHIKDLRAWAFAVAIQAAKRTAMRDVRHTWVEPAILAATVTHAGRGEEDFDSSGALKHLTEQQRGAVERCYLKGLSQRAAAKEMSISVGTLCGHLDAAKKRLKEILPFLMPPSLSQRFNPGAHASNTV